VTQDYRVEFDVHLRRLGHGRKVMTQGIAPPPVKLAGGRVPRVSRLVALAIRLEQLVDAGAVASYADAARLGHVTRARVSQIASLLNLAPDIQEEVLFLPATTRGRDPISERHLRPIAAASDWTRQRRLWRGLMRRVRPA
jgi:hypothetical protein